MAIVLPDPRLEHPGLLIPGRKPTCPVVIDWTHPLTNGLEFFTIFNLGQPVDLVTNTRPSSVYGTPTIRRQRASFSADRYYYAGRRSVASSGRSVICRCNNVKGPDSFDYMLNCHGSQPYSLLLANYSSTYLQLTWGASSGLARSGAGVVAQGEWRTYAGTKDPSNAANGRLYVDGDEISVATSSAGAPEALTGGQIDVGGRSTGDRDFYGDMEYTAFWSRELSEEEVKSFSEHPYQFLIPA